MATRVNLLDYAPQPVISGLNWVLAPLEDPTGLDRPLWRDSSRYQGGQNFDIQALNGVWGQVFRMGISWGYVDPLFATNWGESDGKIKYRSSYHVIYPDQPVNEQWVSWKAAHPQIKVIPRVIDLELKNDTHPRVIAQQVWRMSELVADHDGVRPIIYSRRLLLKDWLIPYWTTDQLNEHYYWLAQYLWDRTREHPGPPTIPDGILEERVILHQTADKKATPAGEAESLSSDWDRWELGDAGQMATWIAEKWGGVDVTPPPTFDELVTQVADHEQRIRVLEEV